LQVLRRDGILADRLGFPILRVSAASILSSTLTKREIIRKEVVNDDIVNPTRFTPNFAAEEEDEKINDCFNGFVWL
jgi:hypothetical protein